ncbi:MAG: hypothetical protein LAO24_18685 [Acidobacteriia bacterium]|nr:hypothetical protein [Terriglobia bacterium]
MSAHTHFIHHGHVGDVWKLWLAEIGIVALAGLGLYFAVFDWLQGGFETGLIALGSLTGMAIVYAFGYLRCLPDVLGGTIHDDPRTLRQRWSDFALLTTFIALPIIVAGYVRAIWMNWSYVDLARALAILLACCWLLSACVVASEKYLGWTMSGGEATRGAGWRAQARRVVRTWGNWLVSLLGVRRALVVGGALALLSVVLAVGDSWGGDNAGYYIVAGVQAWPMTTDLSGSKLDVLLLQGYRGVYVLGLVIAAFVLAAVVPGRLGRTIRSSRILATLSGAIALLQLSQAAVAPADKYRFALWTLTWVVPIAIWLRGARGNRETWDRNRLAVMVFCLPIFLLGTAFLVVLTYFALGFGAFIVGMLLVWWGLVQSRREITEQQGLPLP